MLPPSAGWSRLCTALKVPVYMTAYFRTQDCSDHAVRTLEITMVWYITEIKYEIYSCNLYRYVKTKKKFSQYEMQNICA
jgi:hypothetical protein